jgi:3-oxoacyl-[acyl-carrier protein] reductase
MLRKDDVAVLTDLPEVIHGVVYCPGSINLRPFNRLTAQDFLNDFQQNVLGAIAVIQYLLPRLKKADGASIVLFSSVAVKIGMPFMPQLLLPKALLKV